MINPPADRRIRLIIVAFLIAALLAACERPASRASWSPITDSYNTLTAEALDSLEPTGTTTPKPIATVSVVEVTAEPDSTLDVAQYPAKLPHSMKGYDLYSWQDGDVWYFTLITGTNRMKSFDEIIAPEDTLSDDGFIKITVSGMENLKMLLALLPADEEIIWGGMDLGGMVPTDTAYLTLPPQEMIDELIAYCDTLSLHLTAIKPE